MTKGPLVTELQVEGFVFPPTVKPPGSSKTLILAGAGERGLEIEGKFIKFTTIGVYFEEEAIPFLAVKWKGKSADELMDSVEFFMDIVKGPFEKFTRVTLILPLTGPQFSEKVAENCVRHLKAIGIHTEAVGVAVEKFKEVFSDQIFPPGSSILFTQFPTGSLTIGFSKDESLPEEGCAVIENRPLSTAVLATSIGENGVCPAAKRSIAERLCVLLNQVEVKNVEENGVAKEQ